MSEVRFAAIGATGMGFVEKSLQEAGERGLDFIGADAGGSDDGPFQLAGIRPRFPESAYRRDLTLALREARKRNVPLLVGSSAGSGRNWGVDYFADLVRQISKAEGFAPFKVARIYSEVDPGLVKERMRAGRVHPLTAAPPYDEAAVDRSIRIVGLMGVEPYVKALEAGADVVLAGRSSDTSIFAAVPMMRGIGPAVAWHAAKISECGAAAAWPPRRDIVYTTVRDDHFIVEPLDPEIRCTVGSVAEHQIYETVDPYHLYEPTGCLNLDEAQYDAASDRAVVGSGATFTPAEHYTIKLEGVQFAGHQKAFMMSVRDPVILEHLEEWEQTLTEEINKGLNEVFGDDIPTHELHTRRYGIDGTLGAYEPTPRVGHEVMYLVDVVAHDEAVADTIASIGFSAYVHNPIKYRKGFGTLAWPFNPWIINLGPVHRFNVNHIMEVDDPMELFRMEIEEVAG